MRGRIEWHVLLFVTLALVAFGFVMVYSATSAPAALGNGNPTGYLERQAAYAFIGLVLLVVAARTPYRAWRNLAPGSCSSRSCCASPCSQSGRR